MNIKTLDYKLIYTMFALQSTVIVTTQEELVNRSDLK